MVSIGAVSGGVTPYILGAAATVFGALLTYLAAGKKLSGKIGTTDADRLWDAAEKMRIESHERLKVTESRQTRLEERIADLEGSNNNLTRENIELTKAHRECQEVVVGLRDRLLALQEQLNGVQEKLDDLQEHLTRQGGG